MCGQDNAGRIRQNLRRGVVSAGVHAPARTSTCSAAHAPANRDIRMRAAAHRCVKELACAELHARRIWRQRQRDVAGHTEACVAGFARIGVTRSGDVDGCGRRQIARSGIDPAAGDDSCRGASAGNAVHAPAHGRIGRVADRRRERNGISKQHGTAGRRNLHLNSRRRRRRRRCRRASAAAGSSSAERECHRAQNRETTHSAGQRGATRKRQHLFARKGPHDSPRKQANGQRRRWRSRG